MEPNNNFQNQNSDFENGILKLTAGMAIGLAAMAVTGNPIAGMIAGKVFLVSQQGKLMTNLNSRPVLSKLCVAYLSDASKGGFPHVMTSDTLSRLINQEEVHPYKQMWNLIDNFYISQNWHNLCDESLEEKLNQFGENGFTNSSGVFVSGDEVKKSVKRWREYGWFDYEMKKAKKLKNLQQLSKSFGMLAAFSLISGPLPFVGE